jgi:hypothetical protein
MFLGRPAHNGSVDPRLRAAVTASRQWYDDVFAAHGIPVEVTEDLWWALGTPPAWHSAVKTLVPYADLEAVLHAMAVHEHGTVADSFGTLDLAPHGFDLLIDASWLHRPADPHPHAALPTGWSVVTGPDLLAEWNRHHETDGVLLPALLEHPRFRFLARHEGGYLAAGAVTHEVGDVVMLSNCWTVAGRDLDWDEVLAAVTALHPGRAVVDYEWGDTLDVLRRAGFTPLGPQRVWAR